MDFFELTRANLPLVRQAELALRIVAAAFCGACIGIERGRRSKDAGIRTHCMVACIAALLMVISKYGFTDLLDPAGEPFAGTRGADPARIAAQIVSGISFLGVGVIYRDRRNATRGLTTAAGIWGVAGIGMAIGAGLYFIGLFSTVFMLVVQIVMHQSFFLRDRTNTVRRLDLTMQDGDGTAQDRLIVLLEHHCGSVAENHVERTEDGTLHCRFLLRMDPGQDSQPITNALLADKAVRSVDWIEPNS